MSILTKKISWPIVILIGVIVSVALLVFEVMLIK